jgi:omega-hydroxy-beta-dihydromenaquinone-9 sulfotransferase
VDPGRKAGRISIDPKPLNARSGFRRSDGLRESWREIDVLMYFNRASFLKALKLSLFGRPFRWRRWFYVLSFTLLYLVFVSGVAVLRWLDRLIWRDVENTPIEAPVFIIAPPRSGTSFLQKLLTLDDQRFVFWKMYQTILPTVVTEKCIQSTVGFDRRLGRPVGRLLNWCEKRWFGGWDNLHTMRLDAPEEDGALYLYAFACEAIYMLFPFIEELWELGFPDTLPEEDRRALMKYYRTCLQRLVYSSGKGKTLLIKSTNSSGAVASIREAFPDARFITIIRDPAASIASSISLMLPALKVHSPEIPPDGDVSRAYARLSTEWYKYLHDFTLGLPEHQIHVVDYRCLVRDPAGTIEALYAHFGWKISPEYRSRLAAQQQRQKTYQSGHRYRLEDFGVDREALYGELTHVLSARGFVRADPPSELGGG